MVEETTTQGRVPATRPDLSRILIRETEDGIGVYNPTRRSIPLILFLAIWLCGWSIGEYFALTEILGGAPLAASLFLVVWLTAWTLGGGLALMVLLWQLLGVEKLFLLDAGAVVVERGFWRFTRRRVFPVAEVADPIVRDVEPAGSAVPPAAIAFRVGGRERRFGIGLDREEAQAVLEIFRQFLARHRPPSPAGVPGDQPA